MERRGEGGEGKEEDRSLRSLDHSLPRRCDFDSFWAAYPRKVGKDSARKAWTSAVKRAVPADILAGLARQRWPDNPQFIPHPATWLNGGRWQDDPEAAAPPERGLLGSLVHEMGLDQPFIDHDPNVPRTLQ
jgi:hypothetical protein